MSSRFLSLGASLALLLAASCGGTCPPGAVYKAVSGGGFYCLCPAGTTYQLSGSTKVCAPTADPGPVGTPTDMNPAADSAAPLPATCHLYDAAASSDRAYCTGVYQAGDAAKLCPGGWHVCTAADGSLSQALYAACADPSLGGFMAADIPSYHDPANLTQGACSKVSGWYPALSGCGQEKASATFVVPVCYGWQRSLVCSQSTSVTCTGGSIATATNTNPANGVSCCK